MLLEKIENGYKTPFWSPQLLAADVGKGFFVCGLQNFIFYFILSLLYTTLKHLSGLRNSLLLKCRLRENPRLGSLTCCSKWERGDCFQFARFHKTSLFTSLQWGLKNTFKQKIFTLRHTKIIEGASCPNILAFGWFGPCEVCISEACLDFYILQQTSRCGEVGFGIWLIHHKNIWKLTEKFENSRKNVRRKVTFSPLLLLSQRYDIEYWENHPTCKLYLFWRESHHTNWFKTCCEIRVFAGSKQTWNWLAGSGGYSRTRVALADRLVKILNSVSISCTE